MLSKVWLSWLQQKQILYQCQSSCSSIAPSGIKVPSAPINHASISQAQYDQLITLLQKSNLNSSVPTSITYQVSSSHSHVEPVSGIMCNTVSSPTLSSSSWILDSRANDHICSSLKMICSYYIIQPILVKHPNGNCVIVQYANNIVFSPLLYVHHVLYAPKFSLNLISISKLCQNLNCSAVFFVKQCLLQELNTQRMISLGSEENSLYKLHIKDTHLEANDHAQPAIT